jgi:predicted unusual protein kinase regulating ubiquinone biosynthesis (AarF/ABC1/UbiB family)
MGFIAREGHEETVDKLIGFMQEQFLEEINFDVWSLSELNAETMIAAKMESIPHFMQLDVSMRELTRTFQVPRDWIMLERTLLLLIGLCTYLDPQMNPLKTVRPHLEQIVFGTANDWRGILATFLGEIFSTVSGFVDEALKFLDSVTTDRPPQIASEHRQIERSTSEL